MAFVPEAPKTPTSVGTITVSLLDYDGTGEMMSGNIEVEIVDETGVTMKAVSVKARDVLSNANLTKFAELLTAIRQQAVAELIP